MHNEMRKSKAVTPPGWHRIQAHRATYHPLTTPRLVPQSAANNLQRYFEHLIFLIVCHISPDIYRPVLYYALIVSAVAYRDAIDRILSIPLSEMIGLPLQGKSPHAEDGGPDIDPDAQVTSERTVSIRVRH